MLTLLLLLLTVVLRPTPLLPPSRNPFTRRNRQGRACGVRHWSHRRVREIFRTRC